MNDRTFTPLAILFALLLLPATTFAQDGDREIGIDGESPTDEIERLVDDIQKNMRDIEDLLKNRDTGSATQQKQSQAVDQIQKLIEAAEKAAQQMSSSSGGSQSGQQQQQQSQQNQQQGQQQQQGQKHEGSKEQPGEKKPGEGQQPKDSPGDTRNDGSSDAPMPNAESGALNNTQGQGRWGRLPRAVVQQMLDGNQRRLPERYRVLLEEYYRRLPVEDR